MGLVQGLDAIADGKILLDEEKNVTVISGGEEIILPGRVQKVEYTPVPNRTSEIEQEAVEIAPVSPAQEMVAKEESQEEDVLLDPKEVKARFFKALEAKDKVKSVYEEYNAAVDELVRCFGLDYMFQGSDKTVYETTVCKGRYVQFTPYEVNMTVRKHLGETSGSLAKTKAIAAGFKLDDGKGK